MKIAVDARCLFPDSTDQVSRYIAGFLNSILANYPQHEFYFFTDRPFPPQSGLSKNIIPIQIKSFFQNSFLGHWWYWARLSKVLKKINPDIFLSTDGLTIFKTKVPFVTFLPIVESAPKNNFFNRKYWQQYGSKAVQTSEIIVVSSPEAGQKLMQDYAIEEKKIMVATPVANHYFKRIDFAQQVLIREKYAAGESYFLLPELPVSPENLNLVIEGFYLLKERTRNYLKLIVVGKKIKKGLWPGKTKKLKYNSEAVIFTGPVNAGALAVLYAAAVATIYFPVPGGLNLPVLEAQASGCPLIISPFPVGESLAGTGAFYLVNLSAEDIFTAMAQIYHNIDVRDKLVKLGLANSTRFTWEENSRKFMHMLETTVQAKNTAGAPI